MKNIIHQLTLDLSFPSSETELSVLNQIIDLEYRDKIIQIVQEEMEKISTEQTIVIEKIEINVEAARSIEELIKKIQEELQQQILYYIKTQSSVNQEFVINNKLQQKITTDKVWNFDSICYLLTTGNFYWQEQQSLWQENSKIVFNTVQKYFYEKHSELLPFFIENPYAFIRSLMYFKETSLDFLAKEIRTFTHFREDIKTLIQSITNLESYQLTSVDNKLWIVLLEVFASATKNQIQSLQAVCVLLEIMIKKGNTLSNIIYDFQGKKLELEANENNFSKKLNLVKYNNHQNKKKQLIENYQKKVSIILERLLQKNITLSSTLQRFLLSNITLHDLRIDSIEQVANDYGQNSTQNKRQVNHRISIQNAGLVLLHPFFAYLFEEFKLIKNGVFLNKKGQHKAVQLLHYLATSKSTFTENEVILNKIICGIPHDEPVIVTKSLSSKAKKSCNELLQQTILYWDVLKNTSPKSLQKEFIQRSGTIHEENDQIILNLEKKTVDILLQRLPWGISMIKFPWHDKMIIHHS